MALQRLILMRHGKAEERAPSGKDFDRALAVRGHAEARSIGRRLAEAGFKPDLALVSPAKRASETWDEAGLGLMGVPVQHLQSLYQANPAMMLDAAEGSGAVSVILVGHNPGLHALAFELYAAGPAGQITGAGLLGGFPTAAAAVFCFEAGRPVCEAYFTPKDEDEA